VQKTLVAELASSPYLASSLDGFQMVIDLCVFPASLLTGVLWEYLGITTPFYLPFGLTMVSSFLLLFFVKKKKSANLNEVHH